MKKAASSQVDVKVDLSLLYKLQKNLSISKKYYTKLGILSGKITRNNEEQNSINNAELGLIHEFGSRKRNIPARSFLRFPIEFKAKELTKFIANKEDIEKIIVKQGLKQVYKLLGVKGEAIIQEAFETKGFGTWLDNSPETIKQKGSDKPLIDTSQLRRSITSKVVTLQ
jgi:phage gpG-like protein